MLFVQQIKYYCYTNNNLVTCNMILLRKNKLSILLLAAILLLAGCGVARENRIRQAVLADTSMPIEIRTAIDRKELIVGMTKEQVIASWGLPCKWCFGTRKNPNGDTWEYSAFGSDIWVNGADFLGLGSGVYLFFDQNQALKYWSTKPAQSPERI